MRSWIVISLVFVSLMISLPVRGQGIEKQIRDNPLLLHPDDKSEKSTDPEVLRGRIESLGKVVKQQDQDLQEAKATIIKLRIRMILLENAMIDFDERLPRGPQPKASPKPRPREGDISPARTSTRYARTEQIRKGILDRMDRGDANDGFTSEEWAAIHLNEEEFAEEYGDGSDGVN